MIKFEHSIFALPFALVGAMLAVHGWPTWRQVFWLIVAMVGARSAAMTFNRIADRKIRRAQSAHTMRALPAGRLTLRFAVGFTVLSCGLLALAAWELSPLAFKLSPLAIAVLLLYSYTKRFTVLSHLVLGIADGLAPIAAWIALRNNISLSVLLLGAAVAFWVGGFDLIYACQDIDFDRRTGIHSFPQRFGVAAALYGSIACHLAMVALLVEVMQTGEPRLARRGGAGPDGGVTRLRALDRQALGSVPPQRGILQREWLYQPALLFHLGSGH